VGSWQRLAAASALVDATRDMVGPVRKYWTKMISDTRTTWKGPKVIKFNQPGFKYPIGSSALIAEMYQVHKVLDSLWFVLSSGELADGLGVELVPAAELSSMHSGPFCRHAVALVNTLRLKTNASATAQLKSAQSMLKFLEGIGQSLLRVCETPGTGSTKPIAGVEIAFEHLRKFCALACPPPAAPRKRKASAAAPARKRAAPNK